MGKTLPNKTVQLLQRLVEKINAYEKYKKPLGNWPELLTPVISVEFLKMVDKLDVHCLPYVHSGLVLGLSINQIKIYAKPEFTPDMMNSILAGLKDGVTNQKIKLYAKPGYSSFNIDKLNKIAPAINFKTLKKYLELNLESWEKVTILEFLANHPDTPEEKLDIICNVKNLSIDHYKKLFNHINHVTVEQLKFMANPEFKTAEIHEIATGFINGLSDEQVKFYATSNFADSTQKLIRIGFQNGFSYRKVYFFARENFSYPARKAVFDCLMNGLCIEDVKVILELCNDDTKSGENTLLPQSINLCRTLLEEYLNITDLKSIATSRKLCANELQEILNCLNNGHSKSKVMHFAKLGLSATQLQQIRLGIDENLTKAQISTYAKPEYSAALMEQIRTAFSKGRTVKEVKKMLKACNSPDELQFPQEKNQPVDLYTILAEQLLNQI